MRGVYTATYQVGGLAAAKTLMYLQPPSGVVAEILYASVTDADNATNQQVECSLTRIATLGTPTASSATIEPEEPGDQAAGSIVKADVTASEPTYGNDLHREGAPSLSGWFFEPDARRPVYATNAKPVGIRMLSTPASFRACIELTFREIG